MVDVRNYIKLADVCRMLSVSLSANVSFVCAFVQLLAVVLASSSSNILQNVKATRIKLWTQKRALLKCITYSCCNNMDLINIGVFLEICGHFWVVNYQHQTAVKVDQAVSFVSVLTMVTWHSLTLTAYQIAIIGKSRHSACCHECCPAISFVVKFCWCSHAYEHHVQAAWPK